MASEGKHSLYHQAQKKFLVPLFRSNLLCKVLYHQQLCQMCFCSVIFRLLGLGLHPTGGSAVMIKQSLQSTYNQLRQTDRQTVSSAVKKASLSQTTALKISFVLFDFLAFNLDQWNGGPWGFLCIPCDENRLVLHDGNHLVQNRGLYIKISFSPKNMSIFSPLFWCNAFKSLVFIRLKSSLKAMLEDGWTPSYSLGSYARTDCKESDTAQLSSLLLFSR